MNFEQLAEIHRALSVPVRLEILSLISRGQLCVNVITRSLQVSQPAVSQHLAVLRRAGLVIGKKQGYMVHYSLNLARIEEFRSAVAGFPEIVAAADGADRRQRGISKQRFQGGKDHVQGETERKRVPETGSPQG